jgi:CheY-like chemotaxis protein
MRDKTVTALIIDRARDRRVRTTALLRGAGFSVADCTQAAVGMALLSQRQFNLAIIADDNADGGLTLARRMRAIQPDLKVLLLIAGETPASIANADGIRVLGGTASDGRVRSAVLELLVGPDDVETVRCAEFGIIEAQLACLLNRRAAAERQRATQLARDIAHQIDDAIAVRRHLQLAR